MQMPAWGSGSVGVSVSFESDPACSHWERPAGVAAYSRSPVEYLWLRSRRSAKWGFEDKTVWYGQEKKL